MSAPLVGLLFIFVCYRGRLWFIRCSSSTSTTTMKKDAGNDQQAYDDDDERYKAVGRKTRDLAVWLAIGWLFLVYTILCRTTFRSFACQEIGETHLCQL